MITTRYSTDIAEAGPILRVLRSGLDTPTFGKRFARAVSNGYRVLLAEEGGTAVGALGFRITDDLHWGRTLYIDDLVVIPSRRGGGIGATLLSAAHDAAMSLECDHLRLCSGLDRAAAHRFYEAHGLARTSFQFALAIEVETP